MLLKRKKTIGSYLHIIKNISLQLLIIMIVLILTGCGKGKTKKVLEKKGMVDFHHHILPEGYMEKIREAGIKSSMNIEFPEWSPEKSLDFMKKNGIDFAYVSISSPGVNFKNAEFTKDLARYCNEYMSELKTKYPDKFGGFAVLPLPYVDESIEELKYALDVLHLDGVVLMTNYDGKYLGDNAFSTVYEELNKRNTVVFIHPTDPPYDLGTGIPNALVEAPFETTRAVTNWIHKSGCDNYKNIKIVLSHGGGTIPFIAWRMASIKYIQEGKKMNVPQVMNDYLVKGAPMTGIKILENMYYDTALTSGPSALNALIEFAGKSQIVVGTDFPFAKLAPVVLKNLKNHKGFTSNELEDIKYYNSEKLFGVENSKSY